MRTELGVDDVRDMLEEPLIAVLATRRRDDSIMLSPVWFEWREGGMNIWVPTESGGKVAHIRRDPRVSVVVSTSVWPYRGLELRGLASVSTDPDVFYGAVHRTAVRYEGIEEADRMVRTMPPGATLRNEPGVVRAGDYAEPGERGSVVG